MLFWWYWQALQDSSKQHRCTPWYNLTLQFTKKKNHTLNNIPKQKWAEVRSCWQQRRGFAGSFNLKYFCVNNTPSAIDYTLEHYFTALAQKNKEHACALDLVDCLSHLYLEKLNNAPLWKQDCKALKFIINYYFWNVTQDCKK